MIEIINRDCIEFMDETIETAQMKVGKRFSFKIVNHKMEIIGYCQKCSGSASS